jgi:hypothetical protein
LIAAVGSTIRASSFGRARAETIANAELRDIARTFIGAAKSSILPESARAASIAISILQASGLGIQIAIAIKIRAVRNVAAFAIGARSFGKHRTGTTTTRALRITTDVVDAEAGIAL